MNNKSGYQEYKKIDLTTAPQGKLVVMLYDGAIRFLTNACKALDKKHGTEEVHRNIVKAQDIIYELLSSLNHDVGDISEKLNSIYTYMNQRLTEANISKSKEPVVEVLTYLKELKTAWEEAEKNTSGMKQNSEKEGKSNDTKINITG